MKLRYKVLGVVAVYLIGNALYSDSVAIFFANLFAHFLLGFFGSIFFGLIYIIIPDEIDYVLEVIKDLWDTIILTMEPSGRLDEVLTKIHREV